MTQRTMLLVAVMALLPGAAHAQEAAPRMTVSLDELSRTAVVAPAAKPTPRSTGAQRPARKKDSLLNGILIGIGLGAIAGAASSTSVIDCDECAGFNVPLTFGVVGAAAGAGIGAALDALWHARARTPDMTLQRSESGTTSKAR